MTDESKKLALVRMFKNYGKGLSQQQEAVWLPMLDSYSLAQVSRAVDKYIASGEWAPRGFKDLAEHLPKLGTGNGIWTDGWYGAGGDWGGDWSKATVKYLTEVAGMMLSTSGMAPMVLGDGRIRVLPRRKLTTDTKRLGDFVDLCLAYGITVQQIDEAAEAYRKKTLVPKPAGHAVQDSLVPVKAFREAV